MKTEIQLTEDEKAEILAKREAEKVEAEKLANIKQHTYNETVAEAKVSAQNKLDKKIADNNAYVKRYNDAIAKLTKVCPDFELVSEKRTLSVSVDVYNGDTIENMNEDGSTNYECDNWSRKILLDTLTAEGLRCSIKYTGATVGGKKYGVSCDTQERGEYSFNKKTFDTMHVEGDRFSSVEERKHLRNAKTVVEKILDAVKWDFIDAEHEIEQNSLKERALLLATQQYSSSKVKLTSYATRSTGYREYDMLVVTLKNGIKIELTFRDKDGKVDFTVREIVSKSSINPDALIGALAKISPKNA